MDWLKSIDAKGQSYFSMRYSVLLMACGLKPALITYGEKPLGGDWVHKVWNRTVSMIKELKGVPNDLLSWVQSINAVQIKKDIITCSSILTPEEHQTSGFSRGFKFDIILYSTLSPSHDLFLIQLAFLRPEFNPLHKHYNDYIYVPPYSISTALGYTNYEGDYRGLHDETGGFQLNHDFFDYRIGKGLLGWDVGLINDIEKTIKFLKKIRETFEGFLPGKVNFSWQWCPVGKNGMIEQTGLSLSNPLGARLHFQHINFIIESSNSNTTSSSSSDSLSLSQLQINDNDNQNATSTSTSTSSDQSLLSYKPPSTSPIQKSFNSIPELFPLLKLPTYKINTNPKFGIYRAPLESISIKFEGKGEKEVVGSIKVDGKSEGWKDVRRKVEDKREWRQLDGVDLEMRYGL